MTREEAMNLVKQVLPCLNIDKKIREAFETLIPELAESEDERIRKGLIEALKTSKTVGELKFILPEPTREECITYLEKQKDASYAIEAVDRIDKYIDEHLANAHDMKDSNPDKKYYRGWDDALGKMAGILQDVYSGGKPEESLRDFIDDFPYSDQKEQKPVEWSEEDEDVLNSCISSIEEAKENRYAYKETDGDTSYDHEIAWLKSLRPSWKPNEEHLSALLAIFNDPNNIGSQTCQLALTDLYEQLKKL